MRRDPAKAESDGRYDLALISVRVPEAGRLTGLSRSRLYELMKAGDIKYKKDRASTLILVESLRAFIESRGP